MLKILTAVIGTVAKGAAAKARAGGVAGAVLVAGEPIATAFWNGVSSGVTPQVEQLGMLLGQAVAGYAVGYAITWLSPKNAE